MGAAASLSSVIVALAGNAFVTIIKLIAFLLSGSPAMLSEAIHSFADTGNQLLLFIGLKRGQRAADDRFHYGYGSERFIFGMLSAAGIFFIGCGITLYHGVTSLMTPHYTTPSALTFGVLAAAFVIEGGVLAFAIVSLSRQRGDLPFMRYVRERADPAAVAILLEDSAAVLGVVLAAAGIAATYFTGNPVFDAIASLVIGVLLGVIAFVLVSENREILLGRAVPEGVQERFIDVVLAHPSVRSVRDVKTRELTPESYILKAEITFDNDYIAEKLSGASTEISFEKRDRALRRVSAIVTDLIATEIQTLEVRIREVIPQAKHIDIEVAHPDLIGAEDDDELLA
ncbi:MAG: cation diffusion facilitator family transporter [Deltaproteobacteria bacterium]|nr:cation diffusion facilitator family transporter [Deltaproteobacteria bacterium]